MNHISYIVVNLLIIITEIKRRYHSLLINQHADNNE